MTKPLILFGNSPFINQVDVPALSAMADTVSMNHFTETHPTDYLFFFDDYFPGHNVKKQLFIPAWFNHELDGTRYNIEASSAPFLDSKYRRHDGLCFGHCYFTPSIAINWAILEQYTDIYLVGIDHVEHHKSFEHFDGRECQSHLTPDTHQAFKQYVYNATQHVSIFQCNPAVKDDWALPFKSVEDLLSAECTR